MRLTVTIASSLLLIAAPAALSANGVAIQDPAEQEAIDPETGEQVVVEGVREKKVCRRVTPTGSRVPQRICRTEREEAENLNATREVYTELQSDGGTLSETTEDGIPIANPF